VTGVATETNGGVVQIVAGGVAAKGEVRGKVRQRAAEGAATRAMKKKKVQHQ
jgi:hypothetical protein